MIETVWQRVAFEGVNATKGIAGDIATISSNDSDTGCRKARIYTDDCYHSKYKLGASPQLE